MKKLLVTILFVTILCGCGSATDCYDSVCKKYPYGDVKAIPGYKFNFLVRTTNGDVHIVKTNNLTNAEISNDVIMFRDEGGDDAK